MQIVLYGTYQINSKSVDEITMHDAMIETMMHTL